MSATVAPLALLGGTFDPVHYGHLRAAWEVAEQLGAEVRLLPANVPPHRPQPVLSAVQRVRLLQLALDGQQRLRLDTRELERDGPSYTVDTLHELRAELGPQRPLLLLLGVDAFAGLPSWNRWLQLFELAHIVVLARPGHAPDYAAALREQIAARAIGDAWRDRAAGGVLFVDVSELEISATAIRRQLAAGQEPRFLLPDAVLAEICRNGWYQPAVAPSADA